MIAGSVQLPALLADRCVVQLLVDLCLRQLALPRDDHQVVLERHRADVRKFDQFGLGIVKVCGSAKLGAGDSPVTPSSISVDHQFDVQQAR
jgi:hypothetical protein